MMTVTNFFTRYRHIAPLAILRIAFGAVLFISTLRFILKGWVYDFYLLPKFHFPFMGFGWLHPSGAAFMYCLYGIMVVAALFICLGFFYRIAAPLFFCCFCYTEMLDKTYYLNHYYLVTVLLFLLVLSPAHRYCSLDVVRKPSLRVTHVPAWTIRMFRYQLCLVYFFAGFSKLNGDWILHAMPLQIWLPAKTSLPLIGFLFHYKWTAYFFSWAGALFDLSIPFLLLNRKTKTLGYILVIIFHMLTAALFQIGMFPYFMMTAILIFFDEDFYTRITAMIRPTFSLDVPAVNTQRLLLLNPNRQKMLLFVLCIYFIFQITLPLRYLFYPGNLLWTEEGYRFSWRVMLMEKSGAAFFYVKNPATGRRFEVDNSSFLTPYQERMMETQPDMILQYAHILKQYYKSTGIASPVVTVESYVSLNGTGSRLYIDSTVDLANEKERWFAHKTWISAFTNK